MATLNCSIAALLIWYGFSLPAQTVSFRQGPQILPQLGLSGPVLPVDPALGHFLRSTTYPSVIGVCGVATGDFNRDGKADVLFADGTNLSVMPGKGDGTFGTVIPTLWQGPAGCGLAVADFNRDGIPDVATSRGLLYLGEGDGTFYKPVAFMARAGEVLTADFDGDGNPDLAFAPYSSSGTPVALLLNNGDGSFRPGAAVSRDRFLGSFDMVTGDFNGDQTMDVAFLAYGIGEFAVVLALSDGQGGFRTSEIQVPYSADLAAADFNRDGKADLVVSTSGAGNVLMFEGRGDGTFAPPQASPVRGPSHFVVGDFDGDGNPDLLMFGWDYPNVTWLRGKGDLTFSRSDTSVEPSLWFAATADFDGDGKMDAALTTFYGNTISILAHAAAAESVASIVSAASGLSLIAPRTVATAYGSAFARRTETGQPGAEALSLGGITLEVVDSRGTRHQAPLFYVSPSQINFRIPAGAAAGDAVFIVRHEDGSSSDPAPFRIRSSAPALFMGVPFSEEWSFEDSLPPAATVMRLEPDGSRTLLPYQCGYYCGLVPIVLDKRPVYLSLYGTGIAERGSLDTVRCVIGNAILPVEYVGPAQDSPGLDQVNVRLTDAVKSNEPQRVTLLVDGQATNSGFLRIN